MIHPHLKEVEVWLRTKAIEYERFNTDICFWLDEGETHRVIVRHIARDNELNILLPNHPGLTYKIPCGPFADERVEHFQEVYNKLKSFLGI